MTVYDETVDDSSSLVIFDPDATWKKKEVYDFTAKELPKERVWGTTSIPGTCSRAVNSELLPSLKNCRPGGNRVLNRLDRIEI